MANKITLDSIRESMERQFASTEVEYAPGKAAVLLNPIRLPKERREALLKSIENFQSDDADTDPVAAVEEILDIVAETKAGGEALKKAINGDLPVLMGVLNSYLSEQSVGEASPSAN